jgi:hypothetical protein
MRSPEGDAFKGKTEIDTRGEQLRAYLLMFFSGDVSRRSAKMKNKSQARGDFLNRFDE